MQSADAQLELVAARRKLLEVVADRRIPHELLLAVVAFQEQGELTEEVAIVGSETRVLADLAQQLLVDVAEVVLLLDSAHDEDLAAEVHAQLE